VKLPLLDGSTMTIVPGIHLLGGLGPSAAYAVETSAGIILFDSGLDDDARQLKSQMAKQGLDWKAIRAIFLTHVHGDHCGGAEHLRTKAAATIYAGRDDAAILRSGHPREAIFSNYKMPDHAPHPTHVDVALGGNEAFTFGDAHIQVLCTPGHTPGSTCYLMERGGLRVLFSGDVIMRLGPKPLGTYTTYLAPLYRGDCRAYLATLHELRTLRVPDLLLPGHPGADSVPQSPRVTQERWEALLDQGIEEMQRLEKRYEDDGPGFLDGQPKRLLPDLYYFGDLEGAALYGFFASSGFFLIDAPGGPDLPEVLMTRLRQLDLPPTEPTAVLLTACGERETAGLEALIHRFHVQVVGSPDGIERISERCPTGTVVLSTTQLAAKHWFPVTPITLGGKGQAPIAYLLHWADKNVLCSGSIPEIIDEQSLPELLQHFSRSKADAMAYAASLQQLSKVRPDLWLPAMSSDGQNAHLYGNVWNDALERNFRAVRSVARGR
jgi:glyoxylase-like metal-dependent hydrolase (beta-lactamase superfamily II)